MLTDFPTPQSSPLTFNAKRWTLNDSGNLPLNPLKGTKRPVKLLNVERGVFNVECLMFNV